MINEEEVLEKAGQYYVASLKKQLRLDGNRASRNLEKSIRHEVSKGVLKVYANNYLNAISEGKKATTKNPSREMVKRIERWMQKKNVTVREKSTGRFAKRTGNATFRRKVAWSVARKINRTSWKGSDVIRKSFDIIKKKVDKEVFDGFSAYIENEFKETVIKFKK